MDNSIILTELMPNGLTKFYENKDNETKYLGELNQNDYKKTDYSFYNGSPKLIFFKNKIAYHFVDQKLEVLKDFTNNKNITDVHYANGQFFGFKIN